jgi:hypothetical protein
MTPAVFLNAIVTPNVDALGDNVGDLRLAVNAILTLDALVGIIHSDLRRRGLEQREDSPFRNGIAYQYLEYRILRDAAFALKHGELSGNARLVKRAGQVVSCSGAWDETVWDRAAWDTEAVIWIEANDPTRSRRADEIARAVLVIFRGMV